VAILDADKEGFLRSERSLIQTCGRTARNVNGLVMLYGDKETASMKKAIEESRRRRRIQKEYNRENHITPTSIEKNIDDILRSPYEADYVTVPAVAEEAGDYMTEENISEMVEELTAKMKAAAKRLEFEEAIRLRDQIKSLEKKEWEALTFG
jgi:excinuclease ABC subunit B